MTDRRNDQWCDDDVDQMFDDKDYARIEDVLEAHGVKKRFRERLLERLSIQVGRPKGEDGTELDGKKARALHEFQALRDKGHRVPQAIRLAADKHGVTVVQLKRIQEKGPTPEVRSIIERLKRTC